MAWRCQTERHTTVWFPYGEPLPPLTPLKSLFWRGSWRRGTATCATRDTLNWHILVLGICGMKILPGGRLCHSTTKQRCSDTPLTLCTAPTPLGSTVWSGQLINHIFTPLYRVLTCHLGAGTSTHWVVLLWSIRCQSKRRGHKTGPSSPVSKETSWTRPSSSKKCPLWNADWSSFRRMTPGILPLNTSYWYYREIWLVVIVHGTITYFRHVGDAYIYWRYFRDSLTPLNINFVSYTHFHTLFMFLFT